MSFTRLNRKTMSRAAAFSTLGVLVKYPSASWSGVRSDDGMVVFIVRAEDVIADSEGFRCLLWAPNTDRAESPARDERLNHCILAISHGQAEGLLAFADGQVEPALILSIRVERHRRQYWAKWGSAGRVVPPSLYELPRSYAPPEYALAAKLA
jgi:hypothetical protein